MATLPQTDPQETRGGSVRISPEAWAQLIEEKARLMRAGFGNLSYAELIDRAWAAYKRELEKSIPRPPKTAA